MSHEKYGFVYIWHDCKHKRYYIGCHWGREDDGYICSSSWMKQAYSHRPNDFRRRIISRVYTNRNELHEREFHFLSMIKTHELGKKYYNVRNHHFSHWLTDDKKNISVREKISNTLKTKHKEDSEFREKYLQSVENRDKSFLTPEFISKRTEKIKEGWAASSPPEGRYVKAERGSDLDKQRKRAGHKRYLENRTPEQVEEIKRRVAAGKHGKIQHTCAGMSWWNDGTINKRSTIVPGPEWVSGRIPRKH